jgi:hypothetical protein
VPKPSSVDSGLGFSYRLYVIWDRLCNPPELVKSHERAENLDHAKRETEVDLKQFERGIAVMLAEVMS